MRAKLDSVPSTKPSRGTTGIKSKSSGLGPCILDNPPPYSDDASRFSNLATCGEQVRGVTFLAASIGCSDPFCYAMVSYILFLPLLDLGRSVTCTRQLSGRSKNDGHDISVEIQGFWYSHFALSFRGYSIKFKRV